MICTARNRVTSTGFVKPNPQSAVNRRLIFTGIIPVTLNMKVDNSMRKRTAQLNIRLTNEENTRLIHNAEKCSVSISAYVRMLLSGFQPKPAQPIEYDALICKLNTLYTELQRNGFRTEAVGLRQTLLQIQAELTVPERINVRTVDNNGNFFYSENTE